MNVIQVDTDRAYEDKYQVSSAWMTPPNDAMPDGSIGLRYPWSGVEISQFVGLLSILLR